MYFRLNPDGSGNFLAPTIAFGRSRRRMTLAASRFSVNGLPTQTIAARVRISLSSSLAVIIGSSVMSRGDVMTSEGINVMPVSQKKAMVDNVFPSRFMRTMCRASATFTSTPAAIIKQTVPRDSGSCLIAAWNVVTML